MSPTSAGRHLSIEVPKRVLSSNLPHRDEIAVRAHELFKRRGQGHGQDLADWFEAERQLTREREADGT